MTDDVALLGAAWRRWAEVGAALGPDEWARPTRLPGWTVRTLYAHVSRSPAVLGAALDTAGTAPPERADAAAYFAAFRPDPQGAARTVDAAARAAAEADPAALVECFGTDGPAVLERVARAGAPTLATPAGSIALGDYLLTRLVEATVHLLDLDAAVPVGPPEPDALRRTIDVLAGIVGPAALVEALTGRGDPSTLPLLR